MNVTFYVSSFPIPATCTSTCIQSAVALQLVMFHCFDKFRDFFSLNQNSFSHMLKHFAQKEMNIDVCSGFFKLEGDISNIKT